MILNNLRLQAGLFIQNSFITASAPSIKVMMNLFSNYDFIPATFNEISNNGSSTRLKLSSNVMGIDVFFASNRIDIIANPSNANFTTTMEVDEFYDLASEIAGKICEHYGINYSRLSLITSHLCNEMTPAELDNIYTRCFQDWLISQPLPFEWNFRKVQKLDIALSNQNETLNKILFIDRVQGDFQANNIVNEFDRIKIDFDINTSPENSQTRFDINIVKEFFKKALQIRKDMLVIINNNLIG